MSRLKTHPGKTLAEEIHEAIWALVAGLGRGDWSPQQSVKRHCAGAARCFRRYRSQARPISGLTRAFGSICKPRTAFRRLKENMITRN
jgi:hypothetical protein